MSRAWLYQRPEQIESVGTHKAPWYVGWIDPDGKRRAKSFGNGKSGRSSAERFRQRTQAQLLEGTYGTNADKAWAEFRQQYESQIVPGKAWATQVEIAAALDTFERLVAPGKVSTIKTTTMDRFIALRRQEDSKRRCGKKVSPATVNKELRHLKAALKKARRWGYLLEMPDLDMEREFQKIPSYVSGEHFAKLYEACERIDKPSGLAYPAADWWRGLLVMAAMTGWRIGDLLALRRENVDLDGGTALTAAEDTKGKRDDRIGLHPVVVEHLRRLPGFDELLFPWPYHRRTLDKTFHELCRLAEVPEYGFHDLRRAFATENAENMTADALQVLMRHKSYQTTQRYINLARQMAPAVENLHVPEVLRRKAE